MIPVGIGIDLVDISRIAHLLDTYGERAMARLLTEGERAYCSSQARPAAHVAARVAAKEAAFKALAASGDTEYIGWQEFEVIRSLDGRPALELHGRARRLAAQLKVAQSLVSLTHSEAAAAAVVAFFR